MAQQQSEPFLQFLFSPSEDGSGMWNASVSTTRSSGRELVESQSCLQMGSTILLQVEENIRILNLSTLYLNLHIFVL